MPVRLENGLAIKGRGLIQAMFMKQVAIIGLGLMGGSLGLALKRLGHMRVSAYARRPETRMLALTLGAADSVFDTPQAALQGADVAVFCTPVCSMPDLARECLVAFKPGCVVTDVGSTKAELVTRMESIFRDTGIYFAGSHPMTGSEKTGMESARTDLYEDAVVAITPSKTTPDNALKLVADVWNRVGAHTVQLTPEQHDVLVARTSHLPHLIAALLAGTSGREVSETQKAFCGPGFKDTTRVAAGSPEMWHDIVKTNRAAILVELRHYQSELGKLISRIDQQDYEGVTTILAHARKCRQQLMD